MSKPLFDEVVAQLRRGDVIRWQNVIKTVARALSDMQAFDLSAALWEIDAEFDALLEIDVEDD